MIKSTITLSLTAALVIISCRFPYNPSRELEQSVIVNTPETNSSSIVYPINGSKQTCNPSISNDTVNFKGCMLWLNFSGTFSLNVPEESSFPLNADMHDRLTITDTSNTVKWYMMISEFGVSAVEEIQDPEWSTAADYIVCLVSSQSQSIWSPYVVNLSTSDILQLSSGGLNAVSTPHLWAESSETSHGSVNIPKYDTSGFADKGTVTAFFGTSKVKFAFALKKNGFLSLFYVDFAIDSKPVPLQRPSDRQNWDLESPLISPDGKWIVYNAYDSPDHYESYIQELSSNSKPVLLASGASDPHWWVHPDDPSLLYVVYTCIPGDNLVMQDLSDSKLLDGGAGITYMQQLQLFPGRSSLASIRKIGNPEVVVKLPIKGGLSPDGAFLCTGYDRAYIVRIK